MDRHNVHHYEFSIMYTQRTGSVTCNSCHDSRDRIMIYQYEPMVNGGYRVVPIHQYHPACCITILEKRKPEDLMLYEDLAIPDQRQIARMFHWSPPEDRYSVAKLAQKIELDQMMHYCYDKLGITLVEAIMVHNSISIGNRSRPKIYAKLVDIVCFGIPRCICKSEMRINLTSTQYECIRRCGHTTLEPDRTELVLPAYALEDHAEFFAKRLNGHKLF